MDFVSINERHRRFILFSDNPFSPNSDQQQFSPSNNNVLSIIVVMGIRTLSPKINSLDILTACLPRLS